MVVSVSEAGASVYSASDVAREELPDAAVRQDLLDAEVGIGNQKRAIRGSFDTEWPARDVGESGDGSGLRLDAQDESIVCRGKQRGIRAERNVLVAIEASEVDRSRPGERVVRSKHADQADVVG